MLFHHRQAGRLRVGRVGTQQEQTPQNPYVMLATGLGVWWLDLPLDSESGDSGLLGKDVASNTLNDWLCRGVIVQLL
jgi:hypothetical protein